MDYCIFCNVWTPKGGTKHLILNDGKLWVEFCKECGEKEKAHLPKENQDVKIEELHATMEVWQWHPCVIKEIKEEDMFANISPLKPPKD